MKRAIAVFLLMLLLAGLSSAYAEANLLTNGDFELGTAGTWSVKAYKSQAGYSRIAVTDEQAHAGRYSAVIENASANDARLVYTAKVQPNSMYRLSGYVLVESMEDIGNGANFGIEDIYCFSDCLFDTEGEWQYLEWYGETDSDQTELTLGIRVGGYSAESIGKAYFDDLSLTQVDELPDDVIASLWYDGGSDRSVAEPVGEGGEKSTALFVLLGLSFLALLLVGQPMLDDRSGRSTLVFVLLLIAAAIVRVVMAICIPGYEVDITCFSAWSLRMANLGPANFYAPDYFCDYPPGAMLLLWPIGMLMRLFGNQLLLIKLLPIICDLLGACCLYTLGQKHLGKKAASFLAALYLFNPAALVNGAAWGQMDSVLALLLLLTTLWAMQRKWHIAIPLFVVSALVKPQALLFAPIGGMWLLLGICQLTREQRKQEGKQILKGIGMAVLAALLIVVPFSIGQEQPVGWLFELYAETLSSYAYATLNTANLYYLVGANWRGLDHMVPLWLSLSTASLLAVIGGLLYRKVRKHAVLLMGFAVVHAVLGAVGTTYALYGYATMALVYLFVILCQHQDGKPDHLLFHMALALIGIYVLGIKVHERYLFLAFLLLLASYVFHRDRRVLWLCAGFSVTTFINTAIVLDNAILFGAVQGHLNTDTLLLNNLLCVANLALCGYAMWLGATGLRASEVAEHKQQASMPEGYRRLLLEPSDARLHLTLRDYAIMGVTVVLYSILAFANLGSTVAPQSGWVSTSRDEQVVLDLGQETEFSLLYYAGVSYNNFSVSVSVDGETWEEEVLCPMREGLCYQWKYVPLSSTSADSPANIQWFHGRYVRVNALEAGLNLWEVIARDRNGNELPLTLVSHEGANPELLDEPNSAAALIDEPGTCIGEPSWYNSMYFDEIYHGREAYHNLHGETTYEWTHPPLGKLLMAVGVAIFGMTPFGWRFAGTFMGVLMLPALYLLAMQLTKKRTVAATSMLAFALDLMHFTQTRIATIDSFPLLFILLSYLFMVRYMQTDLLVLAGNEQPKLMTKAFWRSLIPLFLSGLCMGLGIASKWTGAYSAVSLAVLFFAAIIRQARAANWSYDLEEKSLRLQSAQEFTLRRILITCGFCVLFFVLIPVAIYVLSYIPQLLPSGPFTLERVLRTQENMLNYHATPGLGMDHPFQSPWWQWPFILKPIWYVQDHYEPAGYASTILCLGNPWVFYIGAVAMVLVLLAFVLKYAGVRGGRFVIQKGNGDMTLAVLVVGFLAQYLPWTLVPRSMYIYHYFASVPFIILATAWLIGKIQNKTIRHGVIALYLAGAAVLFVVFFPYASGYLTNTEWLEALKPFMRLYY